ncbi:hypothetical protein LTR49_025843 [Elasticomyces elasticus]|nr:hypothetical protein LTR49_025843 [Elasticomyces elasticus]
MTTLTAQSNRSGSFFPVGGTVYLHERVTVTWPYEPDWGDGILLQIWYNNGVFISNIGGKSTGNQFGVSNNSNPGAYDWTPVDFTPGQYYTLNTAKTDSTYRAEFPNPIWLTTASSSAIPTSTSGIGSTSGGSSSSLPSEVTTTSTLLSTSTTNADASSQTSSISTNKGVLIGGAVGGSFGGVLFLGLIGLGVLLCQRRRKARKIEDLPALIAETVHVYEDFDEYKNTSPMNWEPQVVRIRTEGVAELSVHSVGPEAPV